LVPVSLATQGKEQRYRATRADHLPWLFVSARQAQLTRQAAITSSVSPA